MTPHASTINIIIQAASEHNVSYRMVMSRRREVLVVRARHAAIRALHKAKPQLTYTKLGEIFGRHHSTILFVLGRLERKSTTWHVQV